MDITQAHEIANGKESIQHKVVFHPDEIAQMEKDHTQDLIELDTIEEKIAAVKLEHADRIKELKQQTKSARKNIRRGFQYEERECYLCPNYQAGMMEYVDVQTGEILMERKLRPDEKQLKLKTGTNS